MKKLNGNIKIYTSEEVFARTSKSKTLQKMYKEELARLELAYEIKKLRQAQKMTQAQVAKKIDKPQSVIARLESGRHSCTIETLQKIATVFNKEVRLV